MEVNLFSFRLTKVYIPVQLFIVFAITFEFAVSITISPAPVASVNQGERLTLNCDVTEPGNVRFLYWQKGSQSVVIYIQQGCQAFTDITTLHDSRISLECPAGWKTFIMHLDSANNTDHQTEWSCSAVIDGSGSPGSSATTIFVRVPVQSLVISPSTTGSQTVDVTVGQKTAFTCHTGPGGSRPKANLLWYRQQSGLWVAITSGVTENTSNVPGTDGMVITSSDLQYEPDKRDVRIKCTAGNDANGALLEQQSSVNVQYKPELSIQPSGQYQVTVGTRNVELACSITGANPTVQVSTIRWTKGGQYIAGQTGGTLTIGTVQKSDDGNYVCEATNGAGTGTSPSVTVDVRYKPELSIQPSGQYQVTVGQTNVKLTCSITGANPTVHVSTIRWKKGGQYIAGQTGGTLTIGTVHKSDDGNYVCEANNIIGTGTSPSVRVDVRYKPELSIQPNGQYPVTVGQKNVKLTCSITDANPTVQASTIRWKKGGQSIAGQTGGTLTIGTVQKSDDGNYICDANNDIGTGTSPFVKVDVRLSTTSTPAVLLIQERSDIRCDGTSISVFVPHHLLPSHHNVTWRDPSCPVTDNGTHYIDTVGLTQCGTTVQFNNDSVIFENELMVHKNPQSHPVGQVYFGDNDQISVPVKCVYPRKNDVSMTYLPVHQRVRFFEKRFGHLGLEIEQYKTEQFLDPVSSYPQSVALNNEIYVTVGLHNGSGYDMVVKADNCLATPSSSPADPTYYQLIDHGCSASKSVRLFPSQQNEVKFGFRAFEFNANKSSIVYVHCEVSVCPIHDASCVPGCSTRHRRDVDVPRSSHLVSTGPFLLMAAEEGSIPWGTVFGFVCLAVAMAAVAVAAVGWTRKTPALGK